MANYGQIANGIISDPQQLARFNQLNLQYQVYDAFRNPEIQQRLSLSDQQLQQLNRYRQRWYSGMQQIAEMPASQHEQAVRQFEALRDQFSQNVRNVLTAAQLRTWSALYGSPYEFNWYDYFPNSGFGPNSATNG